MKYKILLLIFLVLTRHAAMAQRIRSNMYRATLSTMLAHNVPEVSVQDAAQQQGKATFIDSREQAEYQVSYIPGTLWVGYDDFSIASVAQLPKNQPIIVYCSVGYRSEKIAHKLQKAGFTNVSNLYGGIFEWVNQGHPVINAKGPTTKVHAFSKFWGMWLDKGDKVYK